MTAGPLAAAEFAALMAPLGPFGRAPAIAAGVSGGPHSLALALLARDWAAARGGSLLALVADHGLRPESASEARGVAAMLDGAGIPARVLPLGLPPGPRMQERARAARLAALLGACAASGRPWLLLGHHRADQAETLLFRALRGSGDAGLAAMAQARPAPEALILRPLLPLAPARLEAVCAAAGLRPVRDPSNRDRRFARIRLRAVLEAEEEAACALAAAAAAFAARRARAEGAVASRLAAAAELHPEGFARIDPAALGADAVAVDALARLVRVVGGGLHAPGRRAVARLLAAGGGTLGGAWLRPAAGGRWLLLRDPGVIHAPVPAIEGALWDGRFRLAEPVSGGFAIGRPHGASATTAPRPPPAVLAALPSLHDGHNRLVTADPLRYPGLEARFRYMPAGGAAT